MPVRARSFGMYHALGNPLAIEMGHLFKQQKILEDHGAARPHRERILVVAYRPARVRRHNFLSLSAISLLLALAARAAPIFGSPGCDWLTGSV